MTFKSKVFVSNTIYLIIFKNFNRSNIMLKIFDIFESMKKGFWVLTFKILKILFVEHLAKQKIEILQKIVDNSR